jgi:hypothetical protein
MPRRPLARRWFRARRHAKSALHCLKVLCIAAGPTWQKLTKFGLLEQKFYQNRSFTIVQLATL